MEKVSSTKRFNSKKAKKLITKYGNLIKKTCNNQSLSERDRYSWSVAISHAYEPSYNFLLLRSVTESQN